MARVLLAAAVAVVLSCAVRADDASLEAERKKALDKFVELAKKQGVEATLLAKLKWNEPTVIKALKGAEIKIVGEGLFFHNKEALVASVGFSDGNTELIAHGLIDDDHTAAFKAAFAQKKARKIKIKCVIVGWDEAKKLLRFEKPQLVDTD